MKTQILYPRIAKAVADRRCKVLRERDKTVTYPIRPWRMWPSAEFAIGAHSAVTLALYEEVFRERE